MEKYTIKIKCKKIKNLRCFDWVQTLRWFLSFFLPFFVVVFVFGVMIHFIESPKQCMSNRTLRWSSFMKSGLITRVWYFNGMES